MASGLRLRTVAGFRSLGDKITPPVVVASVVAAVIAAATVGWLLVALPQTSGGSDKRLTFRSIVTPQRTEEVAAQQPAGRPQASSLSVRAVAPKQTGDEFERAARQQQIPSHVTSPAFAAIGTQTGDSAQDAASKEAAERHAEEALRQLRAAQRTAGEAFRQLREVEASAPAPVEPRKQVARALPDPREQQAREQQLVREQQLTRERAAKEAATLLEEQFARERAVKEAAERAKVSALAPAKEALAKEAPRPPQEQKANTQEWDCQPSRETGQVVCNPKKPAATEAKPPAAPKPKVTAAEPAKAPAVRQPQEQKTDARFWDCQPKPPTGEVVCNPMGAPASAKQQ